MYLVNIMPLRCNRVCLDATLYGVISVTNHVSVHLEELDNWEARDLKAMVNLKVNVYGYPLGVEF